MAEDS